MKGFTNYKAKNLSAEIWHYDIYQELRGLGIKKGIVLPPERIKAYILEDKTSRDPAHIMKRMQERHITDDDVQSFIDTAQIRFNQRHGERRAYYSKEGVTVAQKDDEHGWIAKTTWSKSDNGEETDLILKVVNKYVRN